MPITIFFCYAREDEVWLNKLKAHLVSPCVKPIVNENNCFKEMEGLV